MPAKRFSAALPELVLTPADERDLLILGSALEREAIELFEQFLLRHRRRVDSTRWKAVRSKDDLHLYCERDEYLKTWRHASKLQDNDVGPIHRLAASSSVPMLLVTGTTPGSLEDALYGNSFRDGVSLRVQSELLHQKNAEVVPLAMVKAPSIGDPMSVLAVTWSSRKTPTAFVGHCRDLVSLQGVREATLSTGERVGLVFSHSIQPAGLPDSCGRHIRAQASHFCIYRQQDDQRLEVFCMDFTDLRGKALQSTVLKQSMSLLWPRARSCDVGLQKKLHWLMRERQRAKTVESQYHDSVFGSLHSNLSSAGEAPWPQQREPQFCELCDSSFRGNGVSSVFAASSCICQLCRESICSKCVVTKTIAIDVTDEYVDTKEFAFCVACIYHARNTSASTVARKVLHDEDLRSMRTSHLGASRRSTRTSLLRPDCKV